MTAPPERTGLSAAWDVAAALERVEGDRELMKELAHGGDDERTIRHHALDRRQRLAVAGIGDMIAGADLNRLSADREEIERAPRQFELRTRRHPLRHVRRQAGEQAFGEHRQPSRRLGCRAFFDQFLKSFAKRQMSLQTAYHQPRSDRELL